jgi:hypothetical protein
VLVDKDQQPKWTPAEGDAVDREAIAAVVQG